MEKQILRKIIVFALMLALIAGVIPDTLDISAATKPAAPSVSLKAISDGTGIKVTIKKTKNADGYSISIKAPGEKEYAEVKLLKKSGKKKRSVTIKNLSSGEYSVGVRAYKTSGKKNVWGNYSYKSITLKSSKSTGEALSPEEQFKADYPKLQALADNGTIGLNVERNAVRDTFKLGSYNMTISRYGSESPDKTDIEWEVLEYSDDGKSAFVISKNVITLHSYNDKNAKTTWEKCSLRKWLNNEFINSAFSKNERALIKTTTVKTGKNKSSGTKGGNDTEDKIFLLSIEEADKYFLPKNADPNTSHDYEPLLIRKCYFCNQAPADWALRSPGCDQDCFMCVTASGQIDDEESVKSSCGIRPAFWIELTPEMIKDNNLSVGKDEQKTETDIFVTFGTYDYPNNRGVADGKLDKLEWFICDYNEKENKALLLSRYIVKEIEYGGEEAEDNDWEKSDLNIWLNTDFYSSAFSGDEAVRVMINTINEPGIVNVKDKVFALSKAEVEKYIKDVDIRRAQFINGVSASWWLRTPGDAFYCVYSIDKDGDIIDDTDFEDYDGVRPAIYLNLDSELLAEELIPEAPAVKAVPTSDKTGIKVTVDRNHDAEGYDIFIKKSGSSEFEKAASITKDGTGIRSFTIKNLAAGEYTVRAAAYREYENKKFVSPYSNEVKVVLEGFSEQEYLDQSYPELGKLFDKGLIGLNVEFDRDSVKLGSWNNNELEWEVLEYSEDGKSALLMCKTLIEKKKYNNKDKKVTWETCTLRKWLNDNFYNSAFSSDEKEIILLSKVINEDNEEMGTDGGNDTEDKVFIPSYSEYLKYVEENSKNGYIDRSMPAYADGNLGSYWLRTVGRKGEKKDFSDWDEEDWEDYEEEDFQKAYAAVMYSYSGRPDLSGTGVAYESLGVRPMIRIRLTDEMIKDNNLTVGKNKNFSQLYVVFGSQDDKQGSNDLEWQILEYDEENNRAFLLSRYLVGEGSYKEFEVYSDKNVATWADSSIREWLNKDFYDSVFSKEEQSLIKQVEIENPDNPESKTIGGENTSDKIFLLSIPEVQKYFGEKKLKKDCAARICKYRDGTVSEWWLRSPGIGDAGKKTGSVSYVDEPGGVYGNYAAQNGAGIRPALWISLE